MVVMTPALAAFALKTLPDFAALMGLTIGGKKGKKIAKQAGLLKGLLGATELIGGAFGSSSTGLKIGEGKGIASEADSLTDIFKNPFSSDGFADSLLIGEPTQPGLFKPIKPMYGIGAGWGM